MESIREMDVAGFVATILPIALSPGASFSMAASNAARAGFRGVTPVISGTAAGIYIHATMAGLGVSRLLVQSPTAMSVLEFAGTVYLFWLALRMIGDGVSGATHSDVGSADPVTVTGAVAANLLNVKPVLLYLTVVPLFVGVDLSSYVIAASIHVSIMAAFLTLCGAVFAKAARNDRSSDAVAVFNLIAGLFLLAVAVHAAW
jgi:homoserine/homoserine lactone efflux protein